MKNFLKKNWKILIVLMVILIAGLFITGCVDDSVATENTQVENQQQVYVNNQPPPFFEWSLQRQLWSDFYKAENKAVSTWSYIQPLTGGSPIFEAATMGYPIPMDTQLTNPLMTVNGYSQGSVIEQPEPNGLYTSKNTDATIIFCTNDDGTVSPVYSEQKVTAFSFPVKWDGTKFVRVMGVQPSIKLTPKEHK